jgi:hypothetical protein
MTKEEAVNYIQETNRMIEDCRRRQSYIKEICPHDWRYEYDPAGGTDSGCICIICDCWKKNI